MSLFEDLKEFITAKAYTLTEAEEMLDDYRARKRLTSEEYSQLMELAKDLEVNSGDDKLENRFVALEKAFEALLARVTELERVVSEGGGEITPPVEPDGSADNPITAYRGLIYSQGKRYLDPEDNKIYICTRDSVQALRYLPHELIGHYFDYVKDKEA